MSASLPPVRPLPTKSRVLGIAALGSGLVGLDLASRHVDPTLTAGALVLASIVFIPLWRTNARRYGWTWFLWAKTYSIVALSVLVLLLWARVVPSGWTAHVVVLGAIALNILEAVARDWSTQSKINAVAGLVVLAAMPDPSAMTPGVLGFEVPAAIVWILAYTIWNLSFVLGMLDGRFFGHHLAVLGSALVSALVLGPEHWVQSRAMTLTLFLLVYNGAWGFFATRLTTTEAATPVLRRWLPRLSLCAAIPALYVRWC